MTRTRAARRAAATTQKGIREGAEVTVPAEELVVGDVVLLRAGEKVPADLRLLQARDLQIEEALLTGESVPSHKHVDAVAPDAVLGDRSCLAFSGTLVTYGTARGVVIATGAHTELGRINEMLGNVQQITTPLLRQMARFGHVLSYFVLGIATLTFFYGWLFTTHGPGEMFLAAVALAIAAIPEGLPAIMTITLTIGVRRMAQRHAIIRQLPAVDTLGSVTVICSDKTGTLTRNEMTVTTLALADRDVTVRGVGYAPTGDFSEGDQPLDPGTAPGVSDLLATALLCTDSHLRQDVDQYRLEGAPTDGAMLVAAMKAGLARDELRQRFPEIDHIPFSSEHKYSARLVHRPEGGARIAVLGAPDQLLERCAYAQHTDGIRPLDAAAWKQRLEALAAQGLRMLGVARKDLDAAPERLTAEDVDTELMLLGLAGIIDPPRDEAIAAAAECHSAGIRVIMITGDHKLTAQAIAGQIGIANATVRTGGELDQASDDQLRDWVKETNVYARVSPEHKLRLVTALQSHGAVVAMTGDGVNDAPAIKRADVGVGMGVTGTEVTKEAADMVLTDDNFASITSAVREGRTVYDNLRKSVLFILPTNGGEAATLLTAIALGSSLPLTAPQILWVNMVTAVTLALALAFEPPEGDIMRRPPRPPHASIL
ncbi:MAG: HAD-IC family P-type ATPase [Polyangiaceae bacterium]|nr:HAD-IC family P-type ATPase [Polyangiaceae bacterium]